MRNVNNWFSYKQEKQHDSAAWARYLICFSWTFGHMHMSACAWFCLDI